MAGFGLRASADGASFIARVEDTPLLLGSANNAAAALLGTPLAGHPVSHVVMVGNAKTANRLARLRPTGNDLSSADPPASTTQPAMISDSSEPLPDSSAGRCACERHATRTSGSAAEAHWCGSGGGGHEGPCFAQAPMRDWLRAEQQIGVEAEMGGPLEALRDALTDANASSPAPRESRCPSAVLVCCNLGVNRSPTLVLALLVTRCALPLRTAYRLVLRARPHVDPLPQYRRALEAAEAQAGRGPTVDPTRDLFAHHMSDLLPVHSDSDSDAAGTATATDAADSDHGHRVEHAGGEGADGGAGPAPASDDDGLACEPVLPGLEEALAKRREAVAALLGEPEDGLPPAGRISLLPCTGWGSAGPQREGCWRDDGSGADDSIIGSAPLDHGRVDADWIALENQDGVRLQELAPRKWYGIFCSCFRKENKKQYEPAMR